MPMRLGLVLAGLFIMAQSTMAAEEAPLLAKVQPPPPHRVGHPERLAEQAHGHNEAQHRAVQPRERVGLRGPRRMDRG